jgi:predicted dehydrogenase
MALSLGLAGCGIHGSRYARHLLAGDVPGARLAAVSRRDQRRGREFAREHAIAFVADPLELATRPGVDAVVAVLPPELHAPLALACLAARRPVLVEKPLATDVGAAERLVAATAATGTPLMVAHTLRFDGVVRELVRLRERIGTLRGVAINQRFEPAARAWLDEPGSGGIALNTAVHGFDLLRHLTGGEPVEISAQLHAAVTRRTADELCAILRLEPGGVLATLDCARTTGGRSGRIELVGSAGQLWGDHVHRSLELVRERTVERLGPVAASPTVPAALVAFVDCLVRATAPAVSAADGLATLRLAQAAERSAREGRRVTLSRQAPG